MFELVIIGFFFCGQFLKVAVGSISVLKYLSHCTSNSIMADKFEKKINIHMHGHDRSNYYYHVHWKKSRTVHLFSLIARLKKYWLHYRLIFFRSSACPTNQLKKRERMILQVKLCVYKAYHNLLYQRRVFYSVIPSPYKRNYVQFLFLTIINLKVVHAINTVCEWPNKI